MDYFIEIIAILVNMLILIEYGDITIGDFWGLGKETPFEHNIKNGVSVVLINNEKGSKFFEEIKDKIFFEKRTIEEAIKGNNQLRNPTSKHKNYNLFIQTYKESGIKRAFEKTLI